MKKTLISLLSTFLLCGLITGMCMTAQAKSTYESESNDSYSTADKITLGESMTGVISSYDDCDYYKITPTENGKISIKFKHTYEDSYDDWNIYVYMYNNGTYTQLSSDNVDLNSNEAISIPYIGAVANRTYYICVSMCCSGTVGKQYTISTSFTKSNYYEKELNNVYSTATKVTLGHSYSGTINNNDDKDYYKIIPSDNGKISISFNHQYEDSYDDWNVYIYRYLNGEYIELSSNNIDLNGNEVVSLPYIGAVKNGIYYVCVSRCCSGVVGKNYTLKTNFTSSQYYEKEPNNVYSKSTNVILNNTYSGNINNNDDEDVYKVVAPMKGKISITFNHVFADSYDDWNVYIYKYSNGEYSQLSCTNVDLNSNSKTVLPAVGTVKNGMYYIKVSKCCSGVIGKNYTIDINFSFSGSTSFKVSSRSTNSLKLAWSKVGGVSGYQLQRKSGNSYKTVVNTTATSYKMSNLKTGTKYTFRIRAYKELNGKKYYSSWKVLTTSTSPGTPSLKVTAGTKKASLSWNKQTGASGYVVYMATSKNGTYKKVATVKGGTKTSYTKTGLTKGKTYYFKVRAYKTVDGTNIYGAYSAVKSAKIK
ncbi:MAG: fibronectin type III domain-containing protein [Oscillospiraceae bacterium]